MSNIDQYKSAVDGAVAASALSAPIWLQLVERGLGIFMLVGGVALLVLRLAITWREWKKGRANH